MIETTYIRLEKAAEILKTDAETLLMAALEYRFTLFAFLGEKLKAKRFKWLGKETGGPYYYVDNGAESFHIFKYVRLMEDDLAAIINESPFYVYPMDNEACPKKDESGSPLWDGYCSSEVDALIKKPRLFMKTDTLNAILAENRLPSIGTVPAIERHNDTPSRAQNTQDAIIGSLLSLILRGTDEDNKKIASFTTQDQIIGYISDKFPLVFGLKKSNLQNAFAKANQVLNERQNSK